MPEYNLTMQDIVSVIDDAISETETWPTFIPNAKDIEISREPMGEVVKYTFANPDQEELGWIKAMPPGSLSPDALVKVWCADTQSGVEGPVSKVLSILRPRVEGVYDLSDDELHSVSADFALRLKRSEKRRIYPPHGCLLGTCDGRKH